MKRAIIFLIAGTVVACSDSTETPQDDNEGFAFETDETDVQPETNKAPSSLLAGTTWMSEQIGNAVFSQDWWSFAPDNVFRKTDVFAQYGGLADLEKFSGEWEETDGLISVEARSIDGSFSESFTFAIDGMTFYPAAFLPQEHLVWKRTDTLETSSPNGFSSRELETVVTFDDEIVVGNSCNMTIALNISIALSENDAEIASETIEMDCTIDDSEDGAIVRGVTGWSETLESAGIWERYPAHISNALFSEFEPTFLVLEDAIVHPRLSRIRRANGAMPESVEDVPTEF